MKTPVTLDFRHLHARPVVIPHTDNLEIIQVGAGGTGSALAGLLSRLVILLQGRWTTIRYAIVDFDHVEDSNVPRQMFAYAEIGLPKALALAQRYSLAWGIPIEAITQPYTAHLFQPPSFNTTRILVGCVDSTEARAEMHKSLTSGYDRSMRTWLIDAGNEKTTGQILLGCCAQEEFLNSAFQIPTFCSRLPAPGLIHPELIDTTTIPKKHTPAPSCAQLAITQAQSLGINPRMAAEMMDMLTRLLLTGDLTRFATYLDLDTGSMRSLYTTPLDVAQSINQDPSRLFHKTRRPRAQAA